MAAEYQAQITISDWKRIIRELNKIEPELMREMRAKFREIAEPVRHEVRNAIPSRAPIRGMRRRLSPVGLTWNTRGRARTVRIRLKNPKRGIDKSSAIVQLVVPSAAAIMADMAGRGNVRRQGKTEWYVYPLARNITDNSRPGERRHTVTTQGDAFIQALGGPASRFVYPAAEKAMPEARDKFDDVIGRAVDMIERKINGV